MTLTRLGLSVAIRARRARNLLEYARTFPGGRERFREAMVSSALERGDQEAAAFYDQVLAGTSTPYRGGA